MKFSLQIFFFIFLNFLVKIKAQDYSEINTSTYKIPHSVFSYNPFDLLFNKIKCGYQIRIKKNIGLEVNFSRFKNYSHFYSLSEKSKYVFVYSVEVKPKLYLLSNQKKSPGLYFAPFFEYRYMDYSFNNYDFNKNTIGTGVLLGYHFVLWKHLSLDLGLAGAGLNIPLSNKFANSEKMIKKAYFKNSISIGFCF